jgi:dihydroflavonol-4-reductase
MIDPKVAPPPPKDSEEGLMGSHWTLVTGATGLVGNNVVRLLVDRGQPVRVMVRNGADPRPLAGLPVEVVPGDVCDPDAVQRACDGAHCVIHAAGDVHLGWSQWARQKATNVEGTRNVARAAARSGAGLVHVSTVNAIGISPTREPADEDTPQGGYPLVPYVVTKREAESVVLEEVKRGLHAVIVNPDFMLGPWDWKPSSGQMLLALDRHRVLIAPDGWFGPCDVRDVSAAVLVAAERGQSGRRYILSGPPLCYLDAWRLFARLGNSRVSILAPRPIALMLAARAGDALGRLTGRESVVNSAALRLAQLWKVYSSRRAEHELGYHTRPLEETVADAWHWLRSHARRP